MLAQSITASFAGNSLREGPSITILKRESRVFSSIQFLVRVFMAFSCEKVLSTSAVCMGKTLHILPNIPHVRENSTSGSITTCMFHLVTTILEKLSIATPLIKAVLDTSNCSLVLLCKFLYFTVTIVHENIQFIAMLSEPVVKSILSYRDTVESVSSFSAFWSLQESIKKILIDGWGLFRPPPS